MRAVRGAEQLQDRRGCDQPSWLLPHLQPPQPVKLTPSGGILTCTNRGGVNRHPITALAGLAPVIGALLRALPLRLASAAAPHPPAIAGPSLSPLAVARGEREG
jgi:hypothetical protein